MRQRPGPLFRVAVMAALAFGAIAARQQTPPPPPVQTPQPQQPVFRTGVETVAIYATVLDQYDELVKNLTPADFDILDDGKPQEVTIFEAGLQPITAILITAAMGISPTVPQLIGGALVLVGIMLAQIQARQLRPR